MAAAQIIPERPPHGGILHSQTGITILPDRWTMGTLEYDLHGGMDAAEIFNVYTNAPKVLALKIKF